MTNRLRSFLLAVAASLGLGAFAIGPAHALLYEEPNPADFVFIEGNGVYTIINNSQDWWIWGFSVITDATDPGTTQPDWNAGYCSGGNCGLAGSGLLYEQYTGASNTALDIGPGQRSSLFTFMTEGTTPYFMVINPNITGSGEFATFTPTGTIPEPSTWAMLIAGFGFLGLRYGLKRGGLRRLFGAA